MFKIFTSKEKWHREACKYAFNHQSISKEEVFSKMKFGFIDSEGRKHFEFATLDDCPEIRHEEIQITLIEISNRISYDDLDFFADTVLKIANKENSKTKVTDLTAVMLSLKKRRELLYEPDLMFKLCALLYIREDENPKEYNKEIHEDKVKQFKKDAAGGLYDFFHVRGLGKYFDGLNRSKSALMQLQEMENQYRQKEEFRNLLATLQTV